MRLGQAHPEVDYILPLRWEDDHDLADLTDYLDWLAGHARVFVVDGSRPECFRRHHAAWRSLAHHVPPAALPGLNGKVVGVLTGMRLGSAAHVVIADDDVRYDEESLARVVSDLEIADLVGPQNIFQPMPWHAAWDTSRSLLNRAFAADYPGTFAVRRTTFEAMGGYSPDVLFENLELMRTVAAYGGVVRRPLDIFVARRPSTLGRFVNQRLRQAYDDLAQPWRLLLFLPVLPAALSGRRGRRGVTAALALSLGLAECGRRRGGAAAVIPVRTIAYAPAWVLERSLCIWVALLQRLLLGGVSYAGQRVAVAAHSNKTLRRKTASRRTLVTSRGAEAASVGPVAEWLEPGPAAPAQRNDRATRIDDRPIGAGHLEGPPQDQRAVFVQGDKDVVAALP